MIGRIAPRPADFAMRDWQDGWEKFQGGNLSDPAAVRDKMCNCGAVETKQQLSLQLRNEELELNFFFFFINSWALLDVADNLLKYVDDTEQSNKNNHSFFSLSRDRFV